ncbi:MAG: hypothetical protein H5T72_05365 [Actinobacteria bacterium]|nr:hypothetical protein [Actinomycetota bacterium]
MEEERADDVVQLPPHCRLIRDPREIEVGGWREALVSGGDHLKRVLDEYGELGFECLLERIDAGAMEGCDECYKIGERIYRVHVRRRGEPG